MSMDRAVALFSFSSSIIRPPPRSRTTDKEADEGDGTRHTNWARVRRTGALAPAQPSRFAMPFASRIRAFRAATMS
jgi:hypothetical protein